MDLLEMLNENREVLAILAGWIAYGLVELRKRWAGRPLVEVEKTRTFYTAVVLAGLLYLIPAIVAAKAASELPVPMMRLVFGTVLAMGSAVGAYEGRKNVARSLEARRDG